MVGDVQMGLLLIWLALIVAVLWFARRKRTPRREVSPMPPVEPDALEKITSALATADISSGFIILRTQSEILEIPDGICLSTPSGACLRGCC